MTKSIATFVSIATIVSVPLAAEADWVQWPGNGHYYQPVAVPQGITWDDASTAAQAAGGYLATIISAAENSFAFSLIDSDEYWYFDSTYTSGPWIGASQPTGSQPDEDWEWVTGEPFTFTNWVINEPNDGWGGGEDYLHFAGGWSGPRADTWNDLNQDQTTHLVLGYVIESSIPEPFSGLYLLCGSVLLFRRSRR